MLSHMKAKFDTVPFNTWGHSDMGCIFSFLRAVKYKCLLHLFIYIPYLFAVPYIFYL